MKARVGGLVIIQYYHPRHVLEEEVRLKACSLHSSVLLSLRSRCKNVGTLTAKRVGV